eukprot:4346327-Amphidinium_carterae.1
MTPVRLKINNTDIPKNMRTHKKTGGNITRDKTSRNVGEDRGISKAHHSTQSFKPFCRTVRA